MTLPLDADLIVIGSGPAGMAAAVTAAKAGLSVISLDMQPAPGGQVYRAHEANTADPAATNLLGALGPAYAAGGALVRRFRATRGINYRPLTTVWELRADGTVGWESQGRAGFLRAARVILATGAMERPAPFPGWALPGVMTAGAVQTLMKAGQLRPQGRVVMAGTGPLMFLLARQLLTLGVKPALMAFTQSLADGFTALPRMRPGAVGPVVKGLGWSLGLRRAGVRIVRNATGLQALGNSSVEEVLVTSGDRELRQKADLLIVHDGIVPATDLAHCAGLALDWHRDQRAWFPRTDSNGRAMDGVNPQGDGRSRILVTGDARIIGGAEAAEAHGEIAARAVLADLARPLPATNAPGRLRKALAPRPFLDAAFPPGLSRDLPTDDVVLCRCEELTAGDLRKAIRAGLRDIDQIRGVTRCGMGACQGRSCAANLARLIEAECGDASAALRPYRARPPVRPLSLAALAEITGVDPSLLTSQSLEDMSDKSKKEAGDAAA